MRFRLCSFYMGGCGSVYVITLVVCPYKFTSVNMSLCTRVYIRVSALMRVYMLTFILFVVCVCVCFY